jgi:large subunit ribosomal protein LP2
MKHIAAYLLLQLGGNESPSAADIKGLLDSVSISADEERLEKLISELEGKNINDLIAEGQEKLASVPSGGAAPAAAAGGAAAASSGAAAAEEKKEEKEEEKEESDDGEFSCMTFIACFENVSHIHTFTHRHGLRSVRLSASPPFVDAAHVYPLHAIFSICTIPSSSCIALSPCRSSSTSMTIRFCSMFRLCSMGKREYLETIKETFHFLKDRTFSSYHDHSTTFHCRVFIIHIHRYPRHARATPGRTNKCVRNTCLSASKENLRLYVWINLTTTLDLSWHARAYRHFSGVSQWGSLNLPDFL